jgi:hypothetical protein
VIPAVILLTRNLDRLESNRDLHTDYPKVLKSAQTLQANVQMAPQIMPLPFPRKEASNPLSINHHIIANDIAGATETVLKYARIT